MTSLAFAATAALCWGVGSYIGGRTSRTASAATVVGWGSLLSAGILVPGLAVVEDAEQISAGFGLGALSGIFALAGAVSLYQGLALAEAAVVAPLAGVLGAGLPVLGGVLLGERPEALAWAGIGLALPAIWMLTTTGRRGAPSGAVYGVLAGLGFGVEFLILAQTPDTSSLWPIAGAHVGVVAVIAAAAVRGNVSWHLPRSARGPAVATGMFNLAAVSAFLLATRSGLVSLASVVASLYPAPTIALAMLFDGERARRSQLVGAALALAAIGLIAAG